MMEEPKSNRKARVMVLAGLLLVLGSLVAAPTASAATVAPGGGCFSKWWAGEGGSGGPWEKFLGNAGAFVDCVV